MVFYPKPLLKYNFYGMEITINNQVKNLSDKNLTVQQLLNLEIPDKQKGIAIAINNTVVPRTEWETKNILQNDNILIIKATQGG